MKLSTKARLGIPILGETNIEIDGVKWYGYGERRRARVGAFRMMAELRGPRTWRLTITVGGEERLQRLVPSLNAAKMRAALFVREASATT